MTLKYAKLARVERLPLEIQETIGKKEGLVIIETRNPDLHEEFKLISSTGGIREYLLSLGNFNDIEISDE